MQGQEKRGVFTDVREDELRKELEELGAKISKMVWDLTPKIQEYFKSRDEWVEQVDKRIAEKDKQIMGLQKELYQAREKIKDKKMQEKFDRDNK